MSLPNLPFSPRSLNVPLFSKLYIGFGITNEQISMHYHRVRTSAFALEFVITKVSYNVKIPTQNNFNIPNVIGSAVYKIHISAVC